MRTVLPRLAMPVLLACAGIRLAAYPVSFGGMAADLPEGWKALSSEDGGFAATSDGLLPGVGVFQVTWFDPRTFEGATETLEAVRAGLDAQGEAVEFALDGESAALAEIQFRAGRAGFHGYLLSIDSAERDVALLAYADEAGFERQRDFLLSTLDSFHVPGDGRARPGPISQFLSPFPASAAVVRTIPFGGTAVPVRYDPQELDAMQALIEREARMLVLYTDHPARDEAWRRYYRMIYRDSRPRLEPVAAAMDGIDGDGATDAQVAQGILGWLQGFAYERTGSLSDLLSPLSSVIRRAGDCDARALSLVILLSHLGTDGVILVSSVYSHAVAAVAVDAPGLGLMLDGRKYVLAETTKSVPLGWLAEDQRDLANWVVVRFDG